MIHAAAMVPPLERALTRCWSTRFDAARPEIDDRVTWRSSTTTFRTSAEEALFTGGRPQPETQSAEAFPLAAWPDVPTAVILCRHDRLFPPAWLRQVVRRRLGIEPYEIASGHTPA